MNLPYKVFFSIIFYCFVSVPFFAQTISLDIITKDPEDSTILNKMEYTKEHNSKDEALQEIELFQLKLQNIGFLNTSFVTIENDSLITCSFDFNQKIDSAKINLGNHVLEKSFLRKLPATLINNELLIPFEKINKVINDISSYFETKGYSFTEISLSEIKITNSNQLTANLLITTDSKRTVDKVIIKGYPFFPKKLISHYLKLKNKPTFNKQLVTKTDKQVQAIPFIKQLKPSEVLFSKDSTILYIYVEKKSINKVSGIIGFSNETEKNSLILSGSAAIELNNSFNKGERIKLNWYNSQNNKKEFDIHFSTPYIYNTIISPNFNFNLFKKDSTYINTTTNFDFDIKLLKTVSLIPSYSYLNSKTSTQLQLSNFRSFTKQFIGASLNFKQSVDNFMYFGFELGSKKEANTKTTQNIIKFNGAIKIPINSKSSFIAKQTFKSLNTTSILENELFQIGGYSSIRGFDESSIQTNRFTISNFEYHYNLDPSIELYSITDFGYIENHLTSIKSNLYTIGLGFSIISKNNLLNLSYALGKTNDISFKFNNSKVHFNIIYFF